MFDAVLFTHLCKSLKLLHDCRQANLLSQYFILNGLVKIALISYRSFDKNKVKLEDKKA